MSKAKPARWKYTKPRDIKPLDPNKPLAPYRAPSLKAFDKCTPGQGVLDFSGDEITASYDDDPDE